MPIDNEITTWTLATLPPDWQDIGARWAAFHTLLTFLSLAAVAAAIGAALALGRLEAKRPEAAGDGQYTLTP